MAVQSPASTSTALRGSGHATGILFMLAGVFLFAINDVAAKWLLGSYGIGQVILIRTVVAMAILAPLLVRAGLAPWRTAPKPGLQVLRALFSTLEIVLFYAAVIYLPVADAVTFYLASPIYVTILAALLLGERGDLVRWLAVAAGFVGVLIAMEPSRASISWPAVIVILGSLIFSGLMILTRYLRGTSDLVLVTSTNIGLLLVGVLALPFGGWVTPPSGDLLLLAGVGVIALAAHMSVNRSLKFAPASTVVPYQYLLIVWALIFGYLVFGDQPRLATLAGAVLIIAAGLVIFVREQQVDGRDEALPPPP
ncbi:DMT family transporter [Chelatococcus reniformis]|uniref:Permease n=1 Tax=Chelatococcus reniformis TaxID=1494448 RepID=A0A916TXA3_9HYPH|nr:DMT family transporter [Chelatococcus reniformis]GGC46480.1 permease [Chelatococcus reniformis]